MAIRFGIQTIGSEGDISPLIALGSALRKNGHEVSIAIHGIKPYDYSSICEQHDITLIGTEVQNHFSEETVQQLREISNETEWATALYKATWNHQETDEKVYSVSERLCQDHDVIIGHYLCFPAKIAAKIHNKPYIAVQLTHEHSPTESAPPMPNIHPNLGSKLNRKMWQASDQLTDQHSKALFADFYARRQIEPIAVAETYRSEILNLIALSPIICPEKPDWKALHKVPGFFSLAPLNQQTWSANQALSHYLSQGEAPVIMVLGSAQSIYPGSHLQKNIELFIAAAKQAQCRAIIQTHSDISHLYPEDSCLAEYPDIFFIGRAPYEELFKLGSMIVHHGGAGTIQYALQAGVPQIITAFTSHHFYLAYFLYLSGASPIPLRTEETTAEILSGYIQKTLSDEQLHQKSQQLAQQAQQEKGVEQAAKLIEAAINQLN